MKHCDCVTLFLGKNYILIHQYDPHSNHNPTYNSGSRNVKEDT